MFCVVPMPGLHSYFSQLVHGNHCGYTAAAVEMRFIHRNINAVLERIVLLVGACVLFARDTSGRAVLETT